MHLKIIASFLAAGSVTALAASPPVQPKPKLLLTDVVAERGIHPSLVPLISELLLTELDKLGKYDVVGASDVRAMLSHEQQKMLAGCDTNACLSQILGALGTDLVASASLGSLGDLFIINIKIVDVVRARVVTRASLQIGRNESELPEAIQRVVGALVSSGPTAWLSPAKGRECRTMKPIPLYNRPRKHKRTFAIPGGQVLTILDRKDRWTKVRAGQRAGPASTSATSTSPTTTSNI